MSSIKKRDIATSVTTIMFFIISITGVMMFFHIFDQYTKQLHEILGLAFVLFALFHIYVNWKGMRNYFKKKIFITATLLIAFISIGFITLSSDNKSKNNPKNIVINSVINAPLNDAISILGKDVKLVTQKLTQSGLDIKNSTSIQEISAKNNVSAFKIISDITK